MTKPTFAIAVTFRIKPDFVDAFRTRVLQQASDSVQLEPECFQFDVSTEESDASIFFLYETYANADAFAAHKTTAHFLDFDQQVADWIETKEVRRLNLLEN
ncbi:Quinol monooxygenase YgiN [Neorhodopirellula lusitana]|uniref:Quinol monooxygenase YgiN n=1 Tax=Neorhodopirellula lusitana TaxID=445327 RepID=A0ABY1Q3Y4_9BACT|nr:putative quinol monooxygenase [Neorhodopirellula lusitana]SMP58702.1 Quinol monooxygenase YgiN [Neorhodopirellula lusitana]